MRILSTKFRRGISSLALLACLADGVSAAEFTGRVYDHRGSGVADAVLTFAPGVSTCADTQSAPTADTVLVRTDAHGRYRVELATQAVWRMSTRTKAGRTVSRIVPPSFGPERLPPLTLPTLEHTTIHVVDPSGTPLANRTLTTTTRTLAHGDQLSPVTATSDKNGRLSVPLTTAEVQALDLVGFSVEPVTTKDGTLTVRLRSRDFPPTSTSCSRPPRRASSLVNGSSTLPAPSHP